jgi:hypothetical protein
MVQTAKMRSIMLISTLDGARDVTNEALETE